MSATDGEQWSFDPATYPQEIRQEVPAYDELQDAVVAATEDLDVARILELGVGTGETSRRVLAAHPGAELVGIDASESMLAAATGLGGADMRVGRLEDPLPEGPFDLVVSVLAVHHLDGAGKADLFARIAARLRPGGRFVLGDLVVPDDPADVVTPIDGVEDTPSRLDEQLHWLGAAGLQARPAWIRKDLAVIVAEAGA